VNGYFAFLAQAAHRQLANTRISGPKTAGIVVANYSPKKA